MLITLCLIILGYMIVGKDAKPWVEKLKSVDWKSKAHKVICKIKEYAVKAGRVAVRPLLQFYYVMTDAETTTMEKALIYGAIFYTVSPLSIIPAAVYHIFGILDEGAAIAFVYNKVKDKITPAINLKVDETIEEWFGPDYSVSEVGYIE